MTTSSSSYFKAKDPFTDIFLGTPAQIKSMNLYNPQQMNMLDTFLQRAPDTVNQVTDFYKSIMSGDQGYFDALETPARNDFRDKTIPAIMDRVGQTSGLRSSALGQQLGDAGVRLEKILAAQRALQQNQAAAGLQNLMKFGMTPTQQFMNQPRTQGMLEMLPYYAAMIFGA